MHIRGEHVQGYDATNFVGGLAMFLQKPCLHLYCKMDATVTYEMVVTTYKTSWC
jgi:hypothetical protein